MKVGLARAVAAQWLTEHARDVAGFRGAYFSGSTIWLPADAELPPASDVDIVVVTAQDEPGLKLGKFRYLGALLEVTYLSWNQYAGNSHSIAARHFSTYLSLPVSMP